VTYACSEVNPGGTMLIEAHGGIIPEGIGADKPTIWQSIPMAHTMPETIEPEIAEPTT
jgi:hypothetical protein